MVSFIDVHRRPSRDTQGRADLPSPRSSNRWRTMARCCRSPRPPDSRAPGQEGPSGPALGSCAARRGAAARDPAGVRGELARLRRPQDLASARPGGLRGRPLPGGQAHEGHGSSRHHPGQAAQDDDPRQEGALPGSDKVNRQFRGPAPNLLWVSDFTYVATWTGVVHVAVVLDAHARRIVGWRVSPAAHAGFVLEALEPAVHERRPAKGMGLVHHSDRGSQYLSIRTTERLGLGRHRAVRRPRRRQPRQRPGQDGQRPVQGRGDPSARPLAQPHSRRVRRPRWGGRVQQPPSPGTDRDHPAGRGRSKPLRRSGAIHLGRVAKTNRPPANPARFSFRAQCSASRASAPE